MIRRKGRRHKLLVRRRQAFTLLGHAGLFAVFPPEIARQRDDDQNCHPAKHGLDAPAWALGLCGFSRTQPRLQGLGVCLKVLKCLILLKKLSDLQLIGVRLQGGSVDCLEGAGEQHLGLEPADAVLVGERVDVATLEGHMAKHLQGSGVQGQQAGQQLAGRSGRHSVTAYQKLAGWAVLRRLAWCDQL